VKRSFFYGYIVVLVIFILQVVMFGSRVSFGVFVKPLTSEFDWTRGLVAGAFSVSTIVQAMSSIMMGWANDRMGPRFVLTICGILVGIGLMLVSLINSVWQLYLCYVVLVGVGMGSLVAPQMSTIARWFVKRRNLMTAAMMAGGGLGGLIGPPLVTWIVYSYSWREAYLYLGAGVFALMIISAQFLRRDPYKMGQVPYGQESVATSKLPSDTTGLSSKEAFKTNTFWLIALIMFCVGFCLWVAAVHVIPYAIDHGNSPEVAAMVLASLNGAQPLGSIFLGLMADKIGNRKGLVICVCLLFPVAALLFPVSNPWLISLFVMIFALGLGGVSVIQSSITAELFGMKSHGIILGYSVFTFSLGGAVGAYLGGALFDLTGSYRTVFLLCGILILVALMMSIYLNLKRKMVKVREKDN
jgi:OFA family oxalate/formate antiporter-like MFS transporter